MRNGDFRGMIFGNLQKTVQNRFPPVLEFVLPITTVYVI